MQFPSGISAVTLNGGRTDHRILPAHEGQHVIRWFIHDPWAMFGKGDDLDIPNQWIHNALAGLERVRVCSDHPDDLRIRMQDQRPVRWLATARNTHITP
jgi:hypothetical protein